MGFVRVASTSEIPAGTILELTLNDRAIAISNVDGVFYAMQNSCLHRGGPLGQGALEGKIVTCPWHGWQFDVTTGKVAQNDTVGVSCYPIEVRGQDLFVDLG